MSLSAGSLASPCNSRLSRERRGALRLCFPVWTFLRPLITYALPLVSLPLFLLVALSFRSESRARVLASALARDCEGETRRDSPKNQSVLLNYYYLVSDRGSDRLWAYRRRFALIWNRHSTWNQKSHDSKRERPACFVINGSGSGSFC